MRSADLSYDEVDQKGIGGEMARSTKDGDPLLMGYVPAPPGAVDPLDAPAQKTPTSPPPDAPQNKAIPGTARAGGQPLDDLLAEDGSDDAPPFEDELAPPSTPKRALSLPPERMEPPTPPLRLEDPRDLARRLAEEARQKAVASRPAPSPEPEPAPAAPKKSGLAKAPPPQAPAPAPAPAAAASPAPPPAAQPERKRSLAERAARPVSAQDALRAAQEAAAREEEAAKAKRKAAKEVTKAAQQAAKAAAAAQVAADRAAATAAAVVPAPVPSVTPAPTTDLATLVGKGLPGAAIEREIVVQNAVVFRALWTAHRARAQATRDLHLLATASVLLDAVDRLPQGCLVAAQLNLGDRTVAVWADLARGVILGFAEPPEIYLAGL